MLKLKDKLLLSRLSERLTREVAGQVLNLLVFEFCTGTLSEPTETRWGQAQGSDSDDVNLSMRLLLEDEPTRWRTVCRCSQTCALETSVRAAKFVSVKMLDNATSSHSRKTRYFFHR